MTTETRIARETASSLLVNVQTLRGLAIQDGGYEALRDVFPDLFEAEALLAPLVHELRRSDR